MNEVILTGRLATAPELRYSTGANQTAVCRFSLAVDDPYNKEKTDFFRIVVFGKQAENSERFLKKGHRAGVIGRLSSSQYEKNGMRITSVEVIANRIEFMEPKPKDAPASSEKAGSTPPPSAEPEMDNYGGGFAVSDDDVPF